MSKTITICSAKGGVGKSITSIFLSECLSNHGKKVLLIDLDSQNALTFFYIQGEKRKEIINKTIHEVILGKIKIKDAIIEIKENLSFIPADISLVNLNAELIQDRDYKLYKIIREIKNYYDYIIFDTPPNLYLETSMALISSNIVIIPTQLEEWSTRSTIITSERIKKYILSLQELLDIAIEKTYLLPICVEKRILNEPILNDLKNIDAEILPSISRRENVKKLIRIGYNKILLKKLFTYKQYEEIMIKMGLIKK